MTQIARTLSHIFKRHRIVFWYDSKKELVDEFEALSLDGVEKIRLDNNQFAVKYRILREEPEGKFLLYHEGPRPVDLENWLLDVELAHGEFRADQVSLWLSELGLGLEFDGLVAEHAEFFQAGRRRELLKSLLQPDDTEQRMRMKMLAVCVGSEARLDNVLEHLLAELAADGEEKMRLVRRAALDGFLWQRLERAYGYRSETPGVRDFVIELFRSCYGMATGEASVLTNDAVVFLKRWKDSVRHHEAFEALSAQCAQILNIEQDLVQRDFRTLVGVDYFELIDRKILSDLVRAVAGRTMSGATAEQIVRQRRQSHWYEEHEHAYEAISQGAAFIDLLNRAELTVRSLADGVLQYCRSWYQLDQAYRKFIYHARRSGQTTLLDALAEQVENHYTNSFLLEVNDQWQAALDGTQGWGVPGVLPQQRFYERHVQPVLQRGNKIFVVISDALRYEIGEELLSLIRQEDRYDAQLEPALTMLPSYTQLGMAALLPHEELRVDAQTGTVYVDGISSAGSEGRRKILEQKLPGRATAIRAEELMKMNRDQSRALTREHDVVYVYHNRIDAAGDKRESEERVFEAAEETLQELVQVVKKLAGANASNMLVTADHGFIYQNQPIDESDFAGQEATGAEIGQQNRRYVLGRGLEPNGSGGSSFNHFRAADVGLAGDVEMLIPRSINRLRRRGAGSRYVHGGASLQEVLVPVLQINKKRQSDVRTVEVDILRGATQTITTGQLSVAFYQTEAVTDKVQPRTLRAGIYTEAGELISDRHELLFDLDSTNEREREVSVRFVLTQKADNANNEDVILRLDERVGDTSHWREYKAVRYLLRRAFGSDFDF